jgi:hypothetical protein
MLLGLVIGGNTIQYLKRKEAELTKIRQEQELLKTESQQLQEQKNLLEKQKVELEEIKKQLEKKLEAKAQVRVASANSGACVDAMKKVFPEHLWSVGAAIMRAESGQRPNAIGGPNRNGTYDYGCWQINNTEKALDPDEGTKIAWYKYQHSGWNPWTVYKTGAYRRFL